MADPGLHISDACAVTGAVLAQHVVTVKLALRLEQKGSAAKHYSDHCVTLYTNGDKQHPLLMGTVGLMVDAVATVDASLPVLVTPSPPTLLLVQWYANALNPDDGISARELIAGGVLNGAGTVRLQLFDVENTVQGVLHVTGWPFKNTSADPLPVNKGAHALVQQVMDGYRKLQPPAGSTDKFSAVQLQIGDRARPMPIVFFIAHATLMRADPANATAYFENCIRVCSASGRCSPHLLADVLSLPSLGWIYRPDVTRMGADADQWASLHSFPGRGPLAFDCEDGSKAMLELLHVLQNIVFVQPTPSLVQLQQLARRYTGWLCICELKSENGSASLRPGVNYLNHAIALLLCKDQLTLPPITLESTAYCSGVWTPDVMRTLAADERRFAQSTQLMEHTLYASAVDRGNARVKAPIAIVVNQQMYRRVLALVSSTADRTQHILINKAMTTFLLDDKGALRQAVVALDLPTSELLSMCSAEMRLMPACRFPSAPAPSASAACIEDCAFLLPTSSEAARATSIVAVNDSMNLYMFK